jgi:hypothetical protein
MLNLFLSEGTEDDEHTLPSYLAALSSQHNKHHYYHYFPLLSGKGF